MPATYAPGPRCNDVDYTTAFCGCQALNTRYLARNRVRPQHVGGIPVDIPGRELGTGWVQHGEKGPSPGYWALSIRARRRVSVESSPAAPGEPVERLSPAPSETWALWAEARIFAVACRPSV